MRFTLRRKLMLMAGIAALSFVFLVVITSVLHRRASRQLAQIQQTYLPMVELGPRLDAEFAHLGRSLHDAVAAQDAEALAGTAQLRDAFLRELLETTRGQSSQEILALKSAVEEYYQTAYDVSLRLMAKET